MRRSLLLLLLIIILILIILLKLLILLLLTHYLIDAKDAHFILRDAARGACSVTRYLNEGAGAQGRAARGAKPINVRWRMRRPPERPSELELEWRVVADVAPGEVVSLSLARAPAPSGMKLRPAPSPQELLTAYNFGQVGAARDRLPLGARASARAHPTRARSFLARARARLGSDTRLRPRAQDTRSVAGETYTLGRWRKEYAG